MLDSTTTLAVECDHLNKDFGSLAALSKVTLGVKKGEICALIGPNGSGKTTLLKILATLITPSDGIARVCGEDVTHIPNWIRTKIGFISSEERSFFWRLTGKQNLRFFASLYKMNGPEKDRRINNLSEKLGLNGFADRRFSDYSTGMKQALAIVRGFIHDPEVLLLDEPTRSLSPDTAKRLHEVIRDEAKNGKTFLIASHNLNEVEKIADQVAILHKGTLRIIGTLEEVSSQVGFSDDESLDAAFTHFTGNEQG